MDFTGALTSYLTIGAAPAAALGSLLSDLGSQCQAAVEREIGRTFDNIQYCEAYDGNDRPILYLRHDPIVSISSVSISGTALTVQASPTFNPLVPPSWPLPQVIVQGGAPAIRLTDGTTFWGDIQNIIVVYTAGLTDPSTGSPPPDLVRAVVQWAGFLFKQRDRLGWKSQTVGDQMVTFDENIPTDIVAMIARWKRVLIP